MLVKKWMVVTRVVEVEVAVDEEEMKEHEEARARGEEFEEPETLVTSVQNLHEVAPGHGFVPDVFNSREEAEACQAKIQSFNGY